MNLAYETYGTGKIDIVIESGLLSCMGEWRETAKRLAKTHTVLLYERAGVNRSLPSQSVRSPQNIAQELRALLDTLSHEDKLTIIAHSQGGLYAQQFARSFPGLCGGLLLIDPLSADDDRFLKELTPREYKMGGVNKTQTLGLGKTLCRLHLGGIVKKIMRNAPPMYYHRFSGEDEAYILDSFTRANGYDAAKREYAAAHDEAFIAPLREKGDFPELPVYLLTHNSQAAVQESMQFGGADEATAKKVEELWQDIMRGYESFSAKCKHVRAEKSTHYIHLSEPAYIEEGLAWIEAQNAVKEG